jgi:hypothetical protein
VHVVIDHARAAARHPEAASALLADMERKLKRAKVPVPKPDDFEWRYSWAVRIASQSLSDILGLGTAPAEETPSHEPLDNCLVSLELCLGQRRSFHSFHAPGPDAKPMPRADLPPEIVSTYAPKSGVDPQTYPHVATCEIRNPYKGGTETHLATSGYRSKSGTFVHMVAPGDDLVEAKAFEILYRIDDDHAVWSGSLVPTAKERFDATPQGDVFRYRNTPLTRLSDDEVHTLVGGKTFDLVFP